jgi:nitronate monooxygenase
LGDKVAMSLPSALADRLSLPLIAAPMFLVSGPELVIAACRSGVIGAFPTVNCRTTAELDGWLGRITAETKGGAPACANLIVHRSNPRLMADVALVAKHRIELVIASVGSPEPIIGPIHDAGGLVFADIASLRHAEKAIALGVDGLILLTAGAGGQTGWANPLAFTRAVRKMFTGPIVLAGGVSDGDTLLAAQAMGADLAYMGTRFIATHESMAAERYKQMLVESRLDDVLLTKAITGLEANILKPSLRAAGLDPDDLPARGAALAIDKDINPEAPRRWKDVWSAGHSVSGVDAVLSVAELAARVGREYAAAQQALGRRLARKVQP